MKTTIMGYTGIIWIWGVYRDNGKENGSYLALAQPTDSLSERLPAALPGTVLQTNDQSNCNRLGNDTVRKNIG